MKDNEEVLCSTCRSNILRRAQNRPYHASQTSEYILLQSILKDFKELQKRIESRSAAEYT